MEYYKKKKEQPSMAVVYELSASYKYLLDFYNKRQDTPGHKSEQQIRDRINYILKWKVKQRNEIETLYWVLGENYEPEDKL